LEINKNKENQHCGTKPKKIAFGIAPLGIVSIGIVPMGVISIGIVVTFDIKIDLFKNKE